MRIKKTEFIQGKPVRTLLDMGTNPVDGTTASLTARFEVEDGITDEVSYTVGVAFARDSNEASVFDPATGETFYVEDWDGGGSNGLMDKAEEIAVRELRHWLVERSSPLEVKVRDEAKEAANCDCEKGEEE